MYDDVHEVLGHVLLGDCREVLKRIPDCSVQSIVTSPPYWGQREYQENGHRLEGQIGLERTPAEYVDALVDVFRECHRVLRDDGVLLLNLGDCYIGARGGAQEATGDVASRSHARAGCRVRRFERTAPGLNYKDLVGLPWMTAFALRDRIGWRIRQDIVWHKTNAMPESVQDRPTKAHEIVFLMSKSERYFWDWKAIRERATGRRAHGPGSTRKYEDGGEEHQLKKGLYKIRQKKWRNSRSVWPLPTQPFRGGHFAAMPLRLAERCIRASSRMGDVVLDPFFGTGTVGEASDKLGRAWIGIDLGYDGLSNERTRQRALVFSEAAP